MSQSESNRCKIAHTTRSVIENRVLMALEESDRVVILANHEDLKLIIQAMDALQTTGVALAAAQLAADLKQLERAAFS